jgi:hypothetical protein
MAISRKVTWRSALVACAVTAGVVWDPFGAKTQTLPFNPFSGSLTIAVNLWRSTAIFVLTYAGVPWPHSRLANRSVRYRVSGAALMSRP